MVIMKINFFFKDLPFRKGDLLYIVAIGMVSGTKTVSDLA